jgi:hypothetical protein
MRRGLTITKIMSVLAEVASVLAALPVGATPTTPVEHQLHSKTERNGKNRCRHYSALSGNVHYKRDTKQIHVILTPVSLYME